MRTEKNGDRVTAYPEGRIDASNAADVQKELEAIRAGIPTAIAYDIVQVGEDYGSVFEMLRASTYMEMDQKFPGRQGTDC